MTPERLDIIKSRLDLRQPDLTVLMENVIKPHNLAAVTRTLEAVGGMEIHAVSQLKSIRLSQMSAAGTRRWVKVIKHASTTDALQQLKQRGFRLVATSPAETASDYRDIDYTGPIAVLAGEEQDGISEQALALADVSITIPMVGMVQSLNVSVATALVLYEAYRQREAAGLYSQCRLDDATYKRLLFEACHPQVARYCRDKQLPYPDIDDNAELLEPVTDSTTWSEQDFAGWAKQQDI